MANKNIMINLDRAVLLNELGTFGSRRRRIEAQLDSRFGESNWEIRHYVDGEIATSDQVFELYEKAYLEFLKDNTEITDWLVANASDVFDKNPSDTESGLDFNAQFDDYLHLQDIAIRRVLAELGRSFEGDRLIRIHSSDSEGRLLSPGKVPFHQRDLILDLEKSSWWDPGSVEDFYQKSKALLVNPNNISLRLEVITSDAIYVRLDENTYKIKKSSPEILTKIPEIPEYKANSVIVTESSDLTYPTLLQFLLRDYELPNTRNVSLDLIKSVLDKDLEINFNLEKLAKNNPLEVEGSRYIGIISSLVDSCLSQASKYHGVTTGDNKVIRTYRFDNGKVVEISKFNTPDYKLKIKGKLPGEIFVELYKLVKIIGILSKGNYKPEVTEDKLFDDKTDIYTAKGIELAFNRVNKAWYFHTAGKTLIKSVR